MIDINKHIVSGRVGKDAPKVSQKDGKTNLATFSVATGESWPDKDNPGQWVKDTTWHKIVCWGRSAEYAEKHVKPGVGVYIEGKTKTRSYVDNEGVKRHITETVADVIKVDFATVKKDATTADEPPAHIDTDEPSPF
jgi:single-strand DNA-binding protein